MGDFKKATEKAGPINTSKKQKALGYTINKPMKKEEVIAQTGIKPPKNGK